jgi:hypothetical protein
LEISCDTEFDLYIKKGTDLLPDPSNFDSVMRSENRVGLNNFSFDTSRGLIVAVYLYHTEPVALHVKASQEHMMVLSTASAAAPMYNLPKPDPMEQGGPDDFVLEDWQYMLIGAILGVLCTLVYWRYATFQQNQQFHPDDPNQFLRN